MTNKKNKTVTIRSRIWKKNIKKKVIVKINRNMKKIVLTAKITPKIMILRKKAKNYRKTVN